MKESDITRFLNSRHAFWLVAVIVMAGTVTAYITGQVESISIMKGFCIPSAHTWISSPELSLAAAFALNGAIAFTLVYLNKRFNLLRSISLLFATSFLVIQGAMPMLTGQLTSGCVACLFVLLAIIPLYTTFQKPVMTRRLFLVFFLLSLTTTLSFTYIGYIIVFLVGCFQMQNISLRGFLAMLIGIITPYWILFGFGLVSVHDFSFWSFISIFDALSGSELAQMLVYVGLTFFIGLVCGCVNLFRIYGYNARTRAYNGFWIVLSAMTVLLIGIDYSHLVIYLPVLNCCTAIQIGTFFVINNKKRTYIPILCIFAAYMLLYLWNLTM